MSERASTLSSPASRGSRSRRGTLLRQDASQSFGSTAWKPDGSTEQAPAPVQQAPFPSSATMNNLDLSYDYHHANNLSEHSPGFDSDAWMFHQQSIYPMSSAQSSGRISQNHTVDPSSLSAFRDRRSVTESQNEHPGHDDAADDDYGSGTTRQANVEQSNALSAQGLAERGNLYAYMMAQDQVASSKANIPAGLYSHLSPHHQIQRPLDTFTMSLNQYPQQRSPTSRSSHMTSAQGRDPASLTYENGTMIRSDEVVDRSHRLRPSLSRISGKGHNVDSPMPSHSPISGNPTELDTASNLVGDTQEATGPPKRKYSGSDNTPRIKRRYSPTSRSSVALRRKLGSCATCRKRKVKKCHRPRGSNQDCIPPSQRRTSAPPVTDLVRHQDIPTHSRERARSDVSPRRHRQSFPERSSTPRTALSNDLPVPMRFTPAPEISGIDLSGIGLGVDDDGKILEYFQDPSALDLAFPPVPEEDEEDAPHD